MARHAHARAGIAAALAIAALLAGAPRAAADPLPSFVFRLDHGAIPSGPPTFPIAPNDKLKYYGGPVISNVKIVEVAWTSAVDATYLKNLAGFYTAIVKSPFIDWLTEYDSIGQSGYADNLPGTEQHIGRGSYVGTFTLTPANQSKSLLDADIQAELVAQLDAANLPPPEVDKNGNVDSLYMIDFPAGYDITLLDIKSCQQFGAYHFTFTYKGKSVPYGIHPDCGYGFNTATLIHSHELAEALTDTGVGLVEYNKTNLSARPLAWVTAANTAWASYESADLCQGTSAQVAGYTVQKVWSNYAAGCVAEIPICDGKLQPPACRPCNTYDSGNACEGPNPACATAGPSQGQCVPCTKDYAKACAGDTPVCDDTKNTCVGCLTSADCTDATRPVCDQTSQACRPCAKDDECTEAVCDVTKDGLEGQCVPCNNDTQCPADRRCDDHRCVLRPLHGSTPVPEGGPLFDQPQDTGCACDAAGDSRGGGLGLGAGAGVLALALLRRKRARPTRR